ncbi:MAG: hypothetical protein RLZZ84_1512 [Pseudomonadota bacterium]|jgi:hypothetical protein
MDLNLLYFRHQRLLMRAAATRRCADRNVHLDGAAALARDIAGYQRRAGAGAAAGWKAQSALPHPKCGAAA